MNRKREREREKGREGDGLSASGDIPEHSQKCGETAETRLGKASEHQLTPRLVMRGQAPQLEQLDESR